VGKILADAAAFAQNLRRERADPGAPRRVNAILVNPGHQLSGAFEQRTAGAETLRRVIPHRFVPDGQGRGVGVPRRFELGGRLGVERRFGDGLPGGRDFRDGLRPHFDRSGGEEAEARMLPLDAERQRAVPEEVGPLLSRRRFRIDFDEVLQPFLARHFARLQMRQVLADDHREGVLVYGFVIDSIDRHDTPHTSVAMAYSPSCPGAWLR